MGGGRRFRYPRSARLRRGPEIRALLRQGSRARCASLDVYRRVSRTDSARAGIIVPRHGRTIVERNRLKRRLREFVRTEWLPAARAESPAQELIVRARASAYDLGGAELREALRECTRSVG